MKRSELLAKVAAADIRMHRRGVNPEADEVIAIARALGVAVEPDEDGATRPPDRLVLERGEVIALWDCDDNCERRSRRGRIREADNAAWVEVQRAFTVYNDRSGKPEAPAVEPDKPPLPRQLDCLTNVGDSAVLTALGSSHTGPRVMVLGYDSFAGNQRFAVAVQAAYNARPPGWRTGNPPESGPYLVKVNRRGGPDVTILRWHDGVMSCWDGGELCVLGWQPLPE